MKSLRKLVEIAISAAAEVERESEADTLYVEKIALDVSAADIGTRDFISSYFEGFTDSAVMRSFYSRGSVCVCTDPSLIASFEASMPETDRSDEQYCRWQKATDSADILVHRASDPARTRLISVSLRRENRLIMLLPRADEFCRIEAVRAARDLVQTVLIQGGMVPIHASAFVATGGAVCCGGPKFTGKSTTMLNAIVHGCGQFMANDKVLLVEEDGHYRVRALPVAAGLRVGTLRIFPELAPVLTERLSLHCENWKVDVTRLDSSTRVYIRPQSLARLLGCGITARARLAVMLYPRYVPDTVTTRLLRLPESEAAERLQTISLGTEVFVDQPYWRSCIDAEELQHRSRELAVRAARSVPACDLVQNAMSNPEVPHMLMNAVRRFNSGFVA
jgi:hypothetical protein